MTPMTDAPDPSAPLKQRLTDGAVALVDDDEHIARALELWLQVSALSPSLHLSAESLLESLQLHEGQVWVPVTTLDESPTRWAPLVAAVMDLNLTGINGFELARRLRELAPQVPLVVITAATDEDLARHGAIPDGVVCLRKPFRLDELERVLNAD